MAQNYPRSPWYDQSLPQTSGGTASGKQKKHRKKRLGVKIAAISLCVLILIVASVYVSSGSFDFRRYFRTPAGTFTDPSEQGGPVPFHPGEQQEEDAPAEDAEGYAEDFRDFFSEYYMEPAVMNEPSRMEPVHVDTAFRMELHSAEGLEPLSLQALYAACVPSVVGISAATYAAPGLIHWGTGFIVSEDGFIITNQHIIAGTDFVNVILDDGTSYAAGLIGEDTQSDIAVLKIAAKHLPAVQLGNSGGLSVGDEVVAIGNPLGSELSNTLTNGIVSAIDRDVNFAGTTMNLIQTNTALNEGNSGGPLFNMYGQVVGVTNMKMSGDITDVTIEGIGFAIPTTTVRAVADQLIATGSYVRPGIGITVGAIPAQAGLHYNLPDGLYISAVSEGSSAEAVGVRPGDVLTHVNGQPVRKTGDVIAIRDASAVGDEMTLTIFRDGDTFDAVIVLDDLSTLY